MSSPWRVVRVFISSTFLDMQAERNHLVKVVFPRIRERLIAHRIHLVDIDLRWGVTREQAENGRSLQLCLEQIDACRPFFLGLLGERYGCVPGCAPLSGSSMPAWLAGRLDRSITELEMLYGVLESPVDGMRAAFFLREPDFLSDVPEDDRRLYAEERLDVDGRRERLLALKRRVCELAPTRSFFVDTYRCRWKRDPGRASGRVGGLEQFGEQVHDWLLNAVLSTPELQELFTVELQEDRFGLQEEEARHEEFVETRTRVHTPRAAVLEALWSYVRSDSQTPALVTGPSGSGKSSALAFFARQVRRAAPEIHLLTHCIGASPASTSLSRMLLRFCRSLDPAFGLSGEVPKETPELASAFRDLLLGLPPSHRVILILDALNQLEPDDGAHTLFWLPLEISRHVKVILSCTDDMDGSADLGEIVHRRVWNHIEIGPLTTEEKTAIVETVPSLAAKNLEPHQKDLLVALEATGNPLFLLVALEELRGAGSPSQVDAYIRDLPAHDTALDALLAGMLGRLEEDFHPSVVRTVLRLLFCVRNGLTERELSDLAAATAPQETVGDLFPVLRQLRPYLRRNGARLDFGHRAVRDAAGRHGFDSGISRDRVHLILAAHFTSSLDPDRRLIDAPNQLALAGAWDQLRSWLADEHNLIAAWVHDSLEVRKLAAALESQSDHRLTDLYSAVFEHPERVSTLFLGSVAELLSDIGDRQEAVPLWEEIIARDRRAGNGGLLAWALESAGNVYLRLGRLDDAHSAFEEMAALARKDSEMRTLARALGGQAHVLSRLGRLHEARDILREVVLMQEQAKDGRSLATSVTNLGAYSLQLGDWQTALDHYRKAERLALEHGNWDTLTTALYNQADVYHSRYDYQQALEILDRAERIGREHGDLHRVQRVLGAKAQIHLTNGRMREADSASREQLRLCQRLGDPKERSYALVQRAEVLERREEYDGAWAHLQERRQLSERFGLKSDLAGTLIRLAAICLRRGDFEEFERLSAEANEYADQS